MLQLVSRLSSTELYSEASTLCRPVWHMSHLQNFYCANSCKEGRGRCMTTPRGIVPDIIRVDHGGHHSGMILHSLCGCVVTVIPTMIG